MVTQQWDVVEQHDPKATEQEHDTEEGMYSIFREYQLKVKSCQIIQTITTVCLQLNSIFCFILMNTVKRSHEFLLLGQN